MRNEIELETLEERRQSLRLILMYKVVEGLVPVLHTHFSPILIFLPGKMSIYSVFPPEK